MTPGEVVPDRVPYYLLLAGGPGRIPFDVQYRLGAEYAVGRLDLGTAGLERYVASLRSAERGDGVPRRRSAAFFASRHPGDRSTQLSADALVRPLAEGAPPERGRPAERPVAERWGFGTLPFLGASATKANLCDLLTGRDPAAAPALLFSATHGVAWPASDPDQPAKQGALLCQDWPGPGKVGPEHYVAAADLPADLDARGLVTFHFACYGAGTPLEDSFMHREGRPPARIAAAPFVARLPAALLSAPNGPALAVIGHVDRAWGYSIGGKVAGPQLQRFRNAVGRILTGQPVGLALLDFRDAYTALSVDLANLLGKLRVGATIPDEKLAATWIGRNDAQSYVLLGDPAARLPVGALA